MIRTRDEDGVRLFVLDRPEKRNALTLQLIEQLRDGLRAAAEDPGVSGVVVAGTPPDTSAGVDLHEFAHATPDSARTLIRVLAEACAAARLSPKPVAMAIQGHCLGGALELACACDVRVATPGAQLGMPEVALGIPSVIDAALLERHLGLSRAAELVLTGDPISGEAAAAWGLVNRLASADGLLATARALLEQITRHRAAAIASQKQVVQGWLELPLSEAVARSQEALAASFEDGEPQRRARELLAARERRAER